MRTTRIPMMIAVLLLAAFAMPGQAGSYTPQGRRLLSDNSIEDAAEALNSPAAASEIGTAAGEAFKATGEAVKEAVESAMDGKPAPTMSTAAAPASATNSSVQERTQDVAEYQLGAFLLEMAHLINSSQTFNGTHAIAGVNLMQKQLQAEASNWLTQQSNQSANAASDSTNGRRRTLMQAPSANPLTEFAEDLENLPKNVTDTWTDFGEHLGTAQAFNMSYYTEQFKGFLHKLKEPVAVQAGMQLLSNSPCLFSTNLGAIEASATGVSVAPSVVNVGSTAINVAPQAMSISPALISVGATGVNVAPQGLNIAPALIAVTPGRVSINPQGGTISPVDLSVSAPTKDIKEPNQPGGRRKLQQAATEEAAATKNVTLPVPSEGLGNWAALVGRICQAAAGGAGPDAANACLTSYFNHTNHKLESLADRYRDLQHGDLFDALRLDFPKTEIKAPTFYSGSSDVANSNVAALQLGATGVSFSPCAIAASPAAISISATGITIAPTVISASATAVNVQPQALNIAPDLIVVGPYDTTVSGQGLNIAPALITVSPTREAYNPVGPLKIADARVTKTLPALPPGPGDQN